MEDLFLRMQEFIFGELLQQELLASIDGCSTIQIRMIILVGCAQTAAVLDESMLGGMGDRWDFMICWLIV